VIALACSVLKSRFDIFIFQIGIVVQDFASAGPRRQQIEDVSDAYTEPAYAWPAPAYFWVKGNPVVAIFAHCFYFCVYQVVATLVQPPTAFHSPMTAK
jgi:hypothetical protein